MKMALFSPADQEHVNTAQIEEMVCENNQDPMIGPLNWSDL